MKVRASVLVTGVLLVAASAVLAETMYARMSTDVRADKTLSAPVVTRLKQGDAVEIMEKPGRHYRVSVGGKEGWVYYNKLSEEKPEDVAALLAGTPGASMELTEIEAGGALRGLSPMAENYAKGTDVPSWAARAVENMQALKISAAELDAFARQGRLGEYAGGE